MDCVGRKYCRVSILNIYDPFHSVGNLAYTEFQIFHLKSPRFEVLPREFLHKFKSFFIRIGIESQHAIQPTFFVVRIGNLRQMSHLSEIYSVVSERVSPATTLKIREITFLQFGRNELD